MLVENKIIGKRLLSLYIYLFLSGDTQNLQIIQIFHNIAKFSQNPTITKCTNCQCDITNNTTKESLNKRNNRELGFLNLINAACKFHLQNACTRAKPHADKPTPDNGQGKQRK